MSHEAKESIALKDLAGISLGYPFRGAVLEKAAGDVSVVQLKNADPDRGIDWKKLVRTQLPGRREPDWLRPADILFTARGVRNVAILLPEVPTRAVCSPHFFLLRVKNGRVRPDYLAWYLNQPPAQRYLGQSAEGSGVTSIRRQVLEDLAVPLPDLSRQELIARLADAARREKQLLRKLLRNREQQLRLVAQGLIE